MHVAPHPRADVPMRYVVTYNPGLDEDTSFDEDSQQMSIGSEHAVWAIAKSLLHLVQHGAVLPDVRYLQILAQLAPQHWVRQPTTSAWRAMGEARGADLTGAAGAERGARTGAAGKAVAEKPAAKTAEAKLKVAEQAVARAVAVRAAARKKAARMTMETRVAGEKKRSNWKHTYGGILFSKYGLLAG